MRKFVYVVMGSTGEYSDRREWPICAYRDENKAKTHIENAALRSSEIFVKNKDNIWDIEDINEFDPTGKMDYTGNIYWLYAIELK